jgi:uncharacterized membrane protein
MNWLVLMAIVLITAAVRQYFVLRHFGKQKPLILVGSVVATVVLAVLIAPKPTVITEVQKEQKISYATVNEIIETRCSSCHSDNPTDDIFKTPQAGVIFSGEASVKQWAPRIQARVVEAKDMPFMNKTKMTDEERQTLAIWLAQNK